MQKIRVCSLYSGSSANSSYIEVNGRAVLIDIGGGIRKTAKVLEEIGSDYNKIDAIFITHEHSDHISGLSAICNKHKIPIIANKKTLNAILYSQPDIDSCLFREMPTGARAVRNDFEISSFASSHDSAESVGYIIKTAAGNIGVLTDLGEYDENTKTLLSCCHTLVLESNHDEQMLWGGKYPDFLKRRISGPKGHLSNKQTGALLFDIIHKGVKNIILAHLSQENNSPSAAQTTICSILKKTGAEIDKDICIEVAPRHCASKIFEL